MDAEQLMQKRFQEMDRRASGTGGFVYTDFLGLAEISLLKSMEKTFSPDSLTLYGGMENSERLMARFGHPFQTGYQEAFPITCLKLEAKSPKYADLLTHRDILGAIMSLGIERSSLGDILLRDNTGYIFCVERLAPYIRENLTQVKHTPVRLTVSREAPLNLSSGETLSLQVPSVRLDAMISKLYKLPRKESTALFLSKKVFVNGRQCENTSHTAREGDIISVRGYGRFRYIEQQSTTRKGNLVISLMKY